MITLISSCEKARVRGRHLGTPHGNLGSAMWDKVLRTPPHGTEGGNSPPVYGIAAIRIGASVTNHKETSEHLYISSFLLTSHRSENGTFCIEAGSGRDSIFISKVNYSHEHATKPESTIICLRLGHGRSLQHRCNSRSVQTDQPKRSHRQIHHRTERRQSTVASRCARQQCHLFGKRKNHRHIKQHFLQGTPYRPQS